MSKTLVPFLPGPRLVETDGARLVDNSVDAGGRSHRPCILLGQFGVVLRAWAYMKTLGPDLKRASELANNANYIRDWPQRLYDLPFLPCTNVFWTEAESSGQHDGQAPDRLRHPSADDLPMVVHGAIMIGPPNQKSDWMRSSRPCVPSRNWQDVPTCCMPLDPD